MNNKQIEGRIKRAVDKMTPNIYDQVATAPVNKMHRHDPITMQETSGSRSTAIFGLAGVMAVFILVFGLFIGWTQFFQVYGVINLDVNPSIELDVNRLHKVLAATPINADGEAILDGMNLRYVEMETAIDAILGSMIRQGFLASADSAILVTVIMDEETQAREMENTIAIRVSEFFTDDQSPAVYSQSLRRDQELKSLAESYQLSPGVTNLIQSIMLEYPQYSLDELMEMPISQLLQLMDAEEEEIEDKENSDGLSSAKESIRKTKLPSLQHWMRGKILTGDDDNIDDDDNFLESFIDDLLGDDNDIDDDNINDDGDDDEIDEDDDLYDDD